VAERANTKYNDSELVDAVSAFLTAGSSLQKRELPARFTRFEWGMHG
jgi:hypothetical protein